MEVTVLLTTCFFSFPVMVVNGEVIIVKGLDINEFSMQKITLTEAELIEERNAVKHLFCIGDV